MKSRYTSEEISKAKGWFFEKTDKIDKPNENNQEKKRVR